MKNLNQRAARYVFLIGLGFMNVFMFQNCSNWQGQVMVADNVNKLSAEDALPISDIDLGPQVSDGATGLISAESGINPSGGTNISPQLESSVTVIASNPVGNGAGGNAPSGAITDSGTADDSASGTGSANMSSNNQTTDGSADTSANNLVASNTVSAANPAVDTNSAGADSIIENASSNNAQNGNQVAGNDSLENSIQNRIAESNSNSSLIEGNGGGEGETINNDSSVSQNDNQNIADNDGNIADNEIDDEIVDDNNLYDDDGQFDDKDIYDDNPQFACTRDLAILKIKAKKVLQVINSDSKRRGRGLWVAGGELNDLKLRGRHIILNTTNKTINIRSIKSRGHLVICGKFNIERIKSRGRVSFIGADVGPSGGRSRGTLRAFSASYSESNDKWTIFETDKLNGKVLSYGLTAGKFTVDAPVFADKGHNDGKDSFQLFNKRIGTDDHAIKSKVTEMSEDINKKHEDKLTDIKQAVDQKKEEIQKKLEDQITKTPEREIASIEVVKSDRKEAVQSENKGPDSQKPESKPSEIKESFLDKLAHAAHEVVNKCSDAVESLISGGDKKSNSSVVDVPKTDGKKHETSTRVVIASSGGSSNAASFVSTTVFANSSGNAKAAAGTTKTTGNSKK